MFDNLSEKLDKALHVLKGHGQITEINVAETTKEVRRALLDADVNFKIAKEFTNRVKEKALGQNVLTTLQPGQLMVKIVKDELTELMGGETEGIDLSGTPSIILMSGLQGSGKTTFSGKLANFLKTKKSKKPLLVACDVYRPAAIDQLHVVGDQIGVEVYSDRENNDPVSIAEAGIAKAKSEGYNVVIIDTAGRLAVDETIDFWKKNQDKGKPLFVNLWLKDPHTPLWPTDEQRAPYKDFSEDKETYYAVLTDADYHVGRLLDYLEEMNAEENTLIIFSSDNGPAGWGPSKTAGSTAGLRGRKVDIFQGGVNVPFIAYQKGKTAVGKTDSTSVLSAVDLLPTFCELADIDLPKDYHPDGESFAEIFSGETFQRTKPLFWDWRFSRENSKNQWTAGAVRFGDWKLLTNKDKTRTELYNIVNDPFEKNDLVGEEIERAEELLMMLGVWQEELPE